MKTIILFFALAWPAGLVCLAQPTDAAGPEQAVKDSLARVEMIEDSLRLEKLFTLARYPLIKGSKWSGVLPVVDPTEVPDNTHEYKLLFELIGKNPDSLSGEINFSLDEVARILNMHVASGIPKDNIVPVVVIHGPGLETVWNDEAYQLKHSIDNPNVRLVREMEKIGAKFIVCGQAMAFFGTEKEDLLRGIKITLTAQTVLSNNQSKGFVLFAISPDR